MVRASSRPTQSLLEKVYINTFLTSFWKHLVKCIESVVGKLYWGLKSYCHSNWFLRYIQNLVFRSTWSLASAFVELDKKNHPMVQFLEVTNILRAKKVQKITSCLKILQ